MVNKSAGMKMVFEKGFNDQLLTTNRCLDTLYEYLRDNPFRLAVRKACPGFFARINQLTMEGTTFDAYGNFQLLKYPFKEAVVLHRSDTTEMREKNIDQWIYTGANGGVLVSPFISSSEKAVRIDAERLGAKIILIKHEAFPDRFKPSLHDFKLSTEGRMLILSLGLSVGAPLTRDICLRMNALAQSIAYN